MTTEKWREIPGWEGYYAVSDLGNVRSLPRTVTRANGSSLRVPGGQRTLSVNDSGYVTVTLCRPGRRPQRTKVHRLVLLAFTGAPDFDAAEACHNDGDRRNNTLTNLRWDTRSGNARDAVLHGTHPAARKTHCKRGHEFTEENTWRDSRGHRACRTCWSVRRAVAA